MFLKGTMRFGYSLAYIQSSDDGAISAAKVSLHSMYLYIVHCKPTS